MCDTITDAFNVNLIYNYRQGTNYILTTVTVTSRLTFTNNTLETKVAIITMYCHLRPPDAGGTIPTLLRQIVSVANHPPFDKVWLTSVCRSPSAKPGKVAMKWNAEFTEGW